MCTFAYDFGFGRGRRQRAAAERDALGTAKESDHAGTVVVAILDRDDWQANTDIIVIANPTAKTLTWLPRDLWSPRLNNRINSAFALGGGELVLAALADLGFPAQSLLCLRRAATEGALADVAVTVPVFEPLDFWYPLHPTRPIEEGRKAISFRPPQELLSGERLHQWMGARTMINRSGSDLLRLKRHPILLRALLASRFDFETILADPALVQMMGKDPIAVLSKVNAAWTMSVFDTVKDATIDGKEVLLRRGPKSR